MKRVYGFSKTETGIVINIPNVKINDQRFDEMMEVLGDKYPFLRIWRNRKGNVAMSGFIPNAHAMKYVLGIEIGYSTDNLIGSYFQFHTEYKKAVALTKRDELDKVIDYYSFGRGSVYTVMVIKCDNQALAITFPISNQNGKRPKDITGRQRDGIKRFMRRNK